MSANDTLPNAAMKIEDYPDLLNIQDVQQILRISKSLCYKIIKTMPHIRVGNSY